MVLRKVMSRKSSQLESLVGRKQPLHMEIPGISTENGPGTKNLYFSGSNFLELLRPLLESGHTVRFQAHGVSMTPSIQHGDTVTISPVSAHPIQLGDIVAAESLLMSRVVLHRAIKKASGGFIIRGDNAGAPDGFVAEPAIIGKVVDVQRNGQAVHLASGLEAMLLAFLSRHGLLHRLNRLRGLLVALLGRK